MEMRVAGGLLDAAVTAVQVPTVSADFTDLQEPFLAGQGPAPESPLTSEELLGMAFLLLVAGHETTVNLISATVHALLTHPDQLELLREEPELVGAVVEESLRHSAAVHTTAFRSPACGTYSSASAASTCGAPPNPTAASAARRTPSSSG